MTPDARRALALFQDRRQQARRQCLALSVEDAESLLRTERFTGTVLVMWAGGVKKELQIPSHLRILLDKCG